MTHCIFLRLAQVPPHRALERKGLGVQRIQRERLFQVIHGPVRHLLSIVGEIGLQRVGVKGPGGALVRQGPSEHGILFVGPDLVSRQNQRFFSDLHRVSDRRPDQTNAQEQMCRCALENLRMAHVALTIAVVFHARGRVVETRSDDTECGPFAWRPQEPSARLASGRRVACNANLGSEYQLQPVSRPHGLAPGL